MPGPAYKENSQLHEFIKGDIVLLKSDKSKLKVVKINKRYRTVSCQPLSEKDEPVKEYAPEDLLREDHSAGMAKCQ